jgi:hypothetical protein
MCGKGRVRRNADVRDANVGQPDSSGGGDEGGGGVEAVVVVVAVVPLAVLRPMLLLLLGVLVVVRPLVVLLLLVLCEEGSALTTRCCCCCCTRCCFWPFTPPSLHAGVCTGVSPLSTDKAHTLLLLHSAIVFSLRIDTLTYYERDIQRRLDTLTDQKALVSCAPAT